MKRALFIALIAVVTARGYRAYAHHSIAATYIQGQQISIEGDLVSLMFRNPHSQVQCDGVAKNDKTQTTYRWTVEWSSGSQLAHEHVTQDSLKLGDRVVITGNPGRNPAEHRLRMLSIRRLSDGWRWISGPFMYNGGRRRAHRSTL